jgi:hypothetical protein
LIPVPLASGWTRWSLSRRTNEEMLTARCENPKRQVQF